MNQVQTIKTRKEVYFGYKKCPKWLKDKYRKAVNFICSDCKKNEKVVGKLEPHRIIRNCEGGLYTVLPINHPFSNVKMVCKECHKKYNHSRKLNYK